MPEDFEPKKKAVFSASFFQCRCPRCGKSKVFSYPFYNLSKFAIMEESCTNCKLNYFPETGFYFAAMYWSYAIIVGLILSLSIVLNMLHLFDYAIIVIPCTLVVLLPLIMRYSRILNLYIVYPAMYKEKFWS